MKIRSLVASAAAATIAAGLIAAPAHAAVGTDSTAVTVTLGGGTFTIDAPTSATGSGSVTPLSTVSVALSDTTVTDNRGTLVGWGITGTSTGLTGGGTASGSSISAANMLWTTGTIATGGSGGLLGSLTGITVGGGGSLATGAAVATAATSSGGGVYTYPATVAVTVPVNALAGNYTGTVVQTAL